MRSLVAAAVFMLVAACGPALQARPEVVLGAQVQLQALQVGGGRVRLTFYASAAAPVYLPVGAVVASPTGQLQDLVLGRPVTAMLSAHQLLDVEVRAYCMNEERSPVSSPSAFVARGVAPEHVAALAQLTGNVSSDSIQRAIWFVRGGAHHGRDPRVWKVLSLAGVEPPAPPPGASAARTW